MQHNPEDYPGMSDKLVASYACALFARALAEEACGAQQVLLLGIAGAAAGCAGPLQCRWEEIAGGALGLMFGVRTPERLAMADALDKVVQEARDSSPATLKGMIGAFGLWLDNGGRVADVGAGHEF